MIGNVFCNSVKKQVINRLEYNFMQKNHSQNGGERERTPIINKKLTAHREMMDLLDRH